MEQIQKKTIISNESKNVASEAEAFFPFSSSSGDRYLENPMKNIQDEVKDEAHEYLSASMILEKDAKKKL